MWIIKLIKYIYIYIYKFKQCNDVVFGLGEHKSGTLFLVGQCTIADFFQGRGGGGGGRGGGEEGSGGSSGWELV